MAAMLQIVFVLFVFTFAALLMAIWVRFSTNNKVLCWFLEGDRSAKPKLLRIVENDFVEYKDDRYGVDPEYVRMASYPTGWPPFMQVPVPCVLYEVGRFSPVDWINCGDPGASSKEVAAVLDPHWMSLIVKGTKMGQVATDKNTRLLLMISAGASIIGLLFMFYLVQRLGSLESMVNALRP